MDPRGVGQLIDETDDHRVTRIESKRRPRDGAVVDFSLHGCPANVDCFDAGNERGLVDCPACIRIRGRGRRRRRRRRGYVKDRIQLS